MMAHAETRMTLRAPSPIAMLFWEEWHQTRGRLLPLLALFLVVSWLGPMLSAITTLLGWPSEPEVLKEIMSAFAAWLSIPLAGVLLFSYYGRNDMSFAFPTRLFALPVRTPELVAVRMTYAAVVVGVLYSIAGLGIYLTSDTPVAAELLPLCAMCAMAYLQTFGWLTGRFNSVAVLFVATGLAVPVIVGFYATFVYLSGPLPVRELAVFAPFLVACYFASVLAVSLHRHGTTGNRLVPARVRPGMMRAISSRTDGKSGRDDTFASGARAQSWYEGTRLKRLVILTAGALLIPIAALFVLDGYMEIDSLTTDFERASFLLLVTTSIAGMLLVRFDDFDRRSGLQRFLMTRPLTTRVMAFARLKAAAKAVTIGYGVVLIVSLLVSMALGNHWITHVPEIAPGTLFMSLGLHVALTLVLAWTILLMAGPLLVLGLLVGIAAYVMVGVALAMAYVLQFSEATLWIVYGIQILVGVGAVLLGIVWLFGRAWRLGLLTQNDLLRCLAAWVVMGAAGAMYALLAPRGVSSEEQAVVIPIAFLGSVLCVSPVAVVPLIFHWCRHR